MDTGMIVYGVDDSMKSIINGVVETIICWEGLPHHRVQVKNKETGELTLKYIKESELNDPRHFVDF
jgi:peptide chain release factor subunit 1